MMSKFLLIQVGELFLLFYNPVLESLESVTETIQPDKKFVQTAKKQTFIFYFTMML